MARANADFLNWRLRKPDEGLPVGVTFARTGLRARRVAAYGKARGSGSGGPTFHSRRPLSGAFRPFIESILNACLGSRPAGRAALRFFARARVRAMSLPGG